MKHLIAAVILMAVSSANAQQQPLFETHVDPNTGNFYSIQRDGTGNTRVQGFNAQTGSTWSNNIDRSGNQTGIDSQGNYFNYNEQSGSYFNSNGTTCIGKGAMRQCF